MTKLYRAEFKVSVSLTPKDLQRYPEDFHDPGNPTQEELRNFFRNYQDELASSNTGSELLANAPMTLSVSE